MWWWIISTVLPWRPVNYSLLVLVIILKWAVWFPIMVIRHGWQEARHAALTAQPRVSHDRSATADLVPFGAIVCNSRGASHGAVASRRSAVGLADQFDNRLELHAVLARLPGADRPRPTLLHQRSEPMIFHHRSFVASWRGSSRPSVAASVREEVAGTDPRITSWITSGDSHDGVIYGRHDGGRAVRRGGAWYYT
jgi:hypothetical protein